MADAAIDDQQYLSNPAPDVKTREKLEGGKQFVLQTEFAPAGDQPTAIKELSEGILNGERDQVLLGATGTGKTFTMAKMIEETQRPAIILALVVFAAHVDVLRHRAVGFDRPDAVDAGDRGHDDHVVALQQGAGGRVA
ncbi:MAG: DEAD/DEAH box helicase family protein, partial [Pseudomonadota bacterium]